MKNYKILNKNNLFHNINRLKNKINKKQICLMVKANAYGHGILQICKMTRNKVSFFGVANKEEALFLRKNKIDSKILVVGISDDYSELIKNNISFTIESFGQLLKLKSLLIKNKNLKALVHIKLNTGMNRIGVKNINEFKKILSEIVSNQQIVLEGVYTHIYNAEDNLCYCQQLKEFKRYIKIIPSNFKTLIHIGGSYCIPNKVPNYINMIRIGLFAYGYGYKNLKPVMQINSHIIKLTHCKKGEHVGYGNYTLKKNMIIATVPIGYADGVARCLSNKFYFYVKDKKCRIVGNVCMDMLMIDVTHVKCKVGDKVCILKHADDMSKELNTSCYEILTNFSKVRAKTLIK